MGDELLQLLDRHVHDASDASRVIELQSFIWVQGSEEYEE